MDNGLLAMIVPTMPDSIHDRLLDKIQTVFPGELKERNSAHHGKFSTVHFSIYNRYSLQVCTHSTFVLFNVLINFRVRVWPQMSIPVKSQEKESHKSKHLSACLGGARRRWKIVTDFLLLKHLSHVFFHG